MQAIHALAVLKEEGTLLEYPIDCKRPLTECWRCGAIAVVEQACDRVPHSGDNCPLKKVRENQAELYREATDAKEDLEARENSEGFYQAGERGSPVTKTQSKRMWRPSRHETPPVSEEKSSVTILSTVPRADSSDRNPRSPRKILAKRRSRGMGETNLRRAPP